MEIYCVGGHLFALEIENTVLSEKELIHYSPFRAKYCSDDELLFSLKVTDDRDVLPTIGNEIVRFEDEGYLTTAYETAQDGIIVELHTPESECCLVGIGAGYREATAWIGGTEGERRYGLDTALMMMYAFASARLDTLLVHASAVELDGKGYLFLGKSRTGKSTHSRLWQEANAEARLLNDDNPVIRMDENGQMYVFGSPWSGKTGCYRNNHVPVGGIVRLRQAPENRITKLIGIKAYAATLTSCSCMKWNREMAEGVHRTLSRVIDCTGVFLFECRPDSEAAELCMATVTREQR